MTQKIFGVLIFTILFIFNDDVDSAKKQILILDTCQNISNKNLGPILQSTRIKQSFFCSKENLSEIHLFPGTYKRENKCTVIFKLFMEGQSENPLRETFIDAKSIEDNSYLHITFSPVKSSSGKYFNFTIESPDASEKDSITFWFSDIDVLQKGILERNGTKISGDLRFLTFCLAERELKKSSEKKNVILIIIDTLREDHLGCYGNDVVYTPNINKISKDGATFLNCYSTSDITNPSISSIMTGTYPKKHGVHGIAIPIDSKFMTIASFFKNLDYKTAASVGSFLLNGKTSGFAENFDEYFETEINRNADKVTDDIIGWLQKNYDKEFFCLIHFWDPHNPYTPPSPFDKIYGDKRASKPFKLDKKLFPKRMEQLAADWLSDVVDLQIPKDNYKGEVSFVDNQIGRIMKFLKENGVYDDTIINITADHGESLGEHSILFDHAGLYEQQIRVPLIVSRANSQWKKLVEKPAQSLDIYPTLVDLVYGPKWFQDNLDGKSLYPLLCFKDGESKRIIITEYIDASAVSIVYDGWKYIHPIKPYEYTDMHSVVPGKNELYNLTSDSLESRNLIDKEEMRARKLKEQLLEAYLEEDSKEDKTIKIYDKETKEKLKSLGYIN
ncbi:sulfatase [bacterium]|nr:sulfatase [bacterium]